ncbi:MAG: hypothetical protein V4555_09390, partial [Acidobacteriota bacterium]
PCRSPAARATRTRRAGLLVFDGKKLRVFAEGLAGVGVTALAGDEGDFWVGTRTQGVVHWHAGTMETVGVSEGLPDAMVSDVAVSSAGVFVGGPRGVAVIRDGHVERVVGVGLFVRALAVSGETLEVATVDQGVRAIGVGGGRGRKAAGLSAASAKSADSGRDDRFVEGVSAGFGRGDSSVEVERFFTGGGELFAVGSDGLLRKGVGGWTKVLGVSGGGLADANVSALGFGADGRLWVGYFDRGLDVLDVESGRAQHVEDDHVFCVNRIVADAKRGTVDVATANGLVLFDAARGRPVEKQVLGRKDGLISDQVTDVAFSGSGMAVATPAGLTLMGAGGAQSLYSFQGLANNHVYALAADAKSDVVMAGTLAGISMVDAATVRRNVTLRNSGLKRNWITAIAKVGDEWFVGTYGGGVVAMSAAGVVSAMDGAGSGAVVNPNAMLVAGNHVLVGTLDGGMLVFDRRSRRWSTVVEGLPSRDVTAFAERGGEVYVGTANGLVRVAETELP